MKTTETTTFKPFSEIQLSENFLKKLEIIIDLENLDVVETVLFARRCIWKGRVLDSGDYLTKVLPPMSRFSINGERTKKRELVLFKLTNLFKQFYVF
jgi:type I restriction enzyme R subunit